MTRRIFPDGPSALELQLFVSLLIVGSLFIWLVVELIK